MVDQSTQGHIGNYINNSRGCRGSTVTAVIIAFLKDNDSRNPHFREKSLAIKNTFPIPLAGAKIGHMSFGWIPAHPQNHSTGDMVCHAADATSTEWAQGRLRKLHLQLGHMKAYGMIKIVTMADANTEKKLAMGCVAHRSCFRANYQPRNHVINRYLHHHPGGCGCKRYFLCFRTAIATAPDCSV